MTISALPVMDPAVARRRWPLWLGFALGAALVLVVALVAAADLGRRRALATAEAGAEDSATLAIALLRGELEKQRALPLILTRDPDVRSALTGPGSHTLDIKLESIAEGTRTGVIYLLDASGRTIAASNWRTPTSFIGSDYSFRDYFTKAMTAGRAEQFALGTLSNQPGLYISGRVDGPDGPLGVLVVKVEFDRVEEAWRALGGLTYVADSRGVVLLSVVEDWRFHVEAPLDAASAEEIRRTLQFGAAPLQTLPITVAGNMATVKGPLAGHYVTARTAVPTTDWQLHFLLPVDTMVRNDRRALQTTAALALMPVIGLAGLLLWRRQRATERRLAEARIKAELELRVEERTAALAGANARLTDEMAERTRAQERLSIAREELAKAHRLATLGQVTAGVAHEINQPLCAIRTYAENARALLERGQDSAADGALAKVVALTARIGAITEALRGFSRRGGGPLEPVVLADAIAGALMILDGTLRQSDIVPRVDAVPADLKVEARLVELEQVLVNLVRNAVEAVAAVPARAEGPLIEIGVAAATEAVTVTVSDRGAGLDEAELAALFTPFRSSKPRGVGLGLVISHDFITRFGGTLAAARRPGGGCVFTIVLKRVP